MEVGRNGYCRVCELGGEGIRVIRATSETFNGRLKAIQSGANNDFSPLDIGCPSKNLLSAGLPNLPIQVSVRRLIAKKSQDNHPFKLADIIHLPEYLNDPIAVFRSMSTVDDVKVILTEMECNGFNILVIVAPNRNYNGYDVNDIRSIYPKDNIKPILEWIVTYDLLEYADKEKLLNWLGKRQSNSAEVAQLIKEATKIISKE